jgi:hypothetical protein
MNPHEHFPPPPSIPAAKPYPAPHLSVSLDNQLRGTWISALASRHSFKSANAFTDLPDAADATVATKDAIALKNI